jgi:hypothetical protein
VGQSSHILVQLATLLEGMDNVISHNQFSQQIHDSKLTIEVRVIKDPQPHQHCGKKTARNGPGQILAHCNLAQMV